MVGVIQISDASFRRLASGQEWFFNSVTVSGGLTVPVVLTGSGDIRDFFDNTTGFCDWQMQGTQLAAGDDLETSFLKSVFSDRQAAADDVIPDGTTNRRGWWADPTMGSRFWLLERAKLTSDLPKRAITYGKECLQWMLDDGVAITVNVDAAIQFPSALGVAFDILRRDGTRFARNYAWVWKGLS